MISSDELGKLAKESGEKVYWDEQVCGEASLKDIEEEKIKFYLEKRREIRGVKKPEKMNLNMIFDDRFEIVNPGSFPEGVTPEKPRHIPVNPVLCQLMYDVGFIEKYGTGIYMIKELCEEYGISGPEYEISNVETKLVFRSGGKAVVISEIEKLGVELNERQRNALKYAFRDGFITNKIYAEINEVSSKTASLELRALVRKGLLGVEGRGRSTKYVPEI